MSHHHDLPYQNKHPDELTISLVDVISTVVSVDRRFRIPYTNGKVMNNLFTLDQLNTNSKIHFGGFIRQ